MNEEDDHNRLVPDPAVLVFGHLVKQRVGLRDQVM
jgi:hypothetical protein